MNYVQMQTAVKNVLGNMETTDPFYAYIAPAAGAEKISVIWQAANEVLRLKIGANAHNWSLFPELRNTWTIDPLTPGVNSFPRPSDCIIVTHVSSSQSSSLPNWATDKVYSVNYMESDQLALLAKSSTTTTPDYAKLFTRRAKSIFIYPTPDAAHLEYYLLHGIAREAILSDPSQSLFMDEDFHPLVVRLAAANLALLMGWSDTAKQFKEDVLTELSLQRDFTTDEAFQNNIGVTVDIPTRASVYGDE